MDWVAWEAWIIVVDDEEEEEEEAAAVAEEEDDPTLSVVWEAIEEDIRASWNCNSSAYLESETGSFSSS